MSLQIASLGSGSRGNATIVQSPSTSLLIDCGFNLKTARARAETIDIDLASLDGILVTHEHSDHIGGVALLARKYSIPVYTTVGTWHAKQQRDVTHVNYICSHTSFSIGDIEVTPVAVPHDAREPVQFVFESRGVRVGVLTDLGSVSPHVSRTMADLDALLIEFNHCYDMLQFGPYPPSLKRRVGGDKGHLNNQQAFDFVHQLDLNRLKLLVAGHISEKNNSLAQVHSMLDPIRSIVDRVVVVEQDEPLDWLTVS